MDLKRIAKMTDKVAESVKDPLVVLDSAVDSLVASIQEMSEVLPLVKSLTPQQKSAIDKVQDIIDTALSPYTADIIEVLEIFEE